MSERETQDFMSVSSFSQLPFIRPSPSKQSNSKSNSDSNNPVRLFGFDFPHDPSIKEPTSTAENKTTTQTPDATTTAAPGSSASRGETGRKFECHYCCRNFPTSQALGGHQNAHKRERQHAKRVHLQSAMAAHHRQHHHHHHPPIAEGHVYGILNYHRLGSSPSSIASPARFGMEPLPAPPSHCPSWSSGGARFYSGLGSVSQPINGSPLPGLWRVPNATSMGMMIHRDQRSVPLPLFGEHESRAITTVGGSDGGCGASSSSSSSSPSATHHQERCQCDANCKDSILSLDLHL